MTPERFIALGRKRPWATAATVLALLAPLVAAADPGDGPGLSRQQQYAQAARHYHVPASVLLGVSYLESRWDTNGGKPSTDAGYGPMHLTDARSALGGAGGEDARGDTARPTGKQRFGPALTTADTAAGLTGVSAGDLRTDPARNIAGGAALLARYQKSLDAPLSADPADWYGAVAKYSGATYEQDARDFADDVYATLRTGAARTTDDGSRVALAADPAAVPDTAGATAQLDALGLKRAGKSGVDCPPSLGCEWIPATYRQTNPDDITAYVNHDKADRPHDQKVDYIVIHDTEGHYPGVVKLIQDPVRATSWHYTIRSADGHIAQHVRTRDVAWQAGNWGINAKSVGIEHEGFAAEAGAWYTEAMYRKSARLVRYLAERYDVPLNRMHILGHDTVPGTTTATIPGMHWDPGPYWDWAHYFDLLKAPFRARGGASKGMVLIDPDFAANQPVFTGCGTPASAPCPPYGSSSVILHNAPSEDAPLLSDIGMHPDGRPTGTGISDVGSRVSAGQTYAVADRSGDWIAIWYHGLEGWFHNPPTAPVARFTKGVVVVPKPGRDSVPVYGRAYPEASAYPASIPVQAVSPVPYEFKAGQAYAYGGRQHGEYYRAVSFDGSSPGDRTVVRGRTVYYEIQMGLRIQYVKADDVYLKAVH